MSNKVDTIYFAGGCFWGTEHFFKQIDGVTDTEVGYANSVIPHPTYREVCTGQTQAVEGVRVVYDTAKIDLPYLIRLYLMTIDPTSVNRQGNDAGTQYRTGIYYTTADQQRTAIAELDKEAPPPFPTACRRDKTAYQFLFGRRISSGLSRQESGRILSYQSKAF